MIAISDDYADIYDIFTSKIKSKVKILDSKKMKEQICQDATVKSFNLTKYEREWRNLYRFSTLFDNHKYRSPLS